MKPKYRFRVVWRQYRPGDAVPDTFGVGVLEALKQARRIEPVTVSGDARPSPAAPPRSARTFRRTPQPAA